MNTAPNTTTTLEAIRRLRLATGAGVMACRKALEQAGNDPEQALAGLRAAAERQAARRSDHETRCGRIELYSHNHGRIGVMLELNTETDFAARSPEFRRLAAELALHITAAAPRYVSDDDIPASVLAAVEQEAAARLRLAGKPEAVAARIAAGAVEDFKQAHVLLRQAYIRDESLTVAQLLAQAAARTGENIVIRRFARWEVFPDSEDAPPAA